MFFFASIRGNFCALCDLSGLLMAFWLRQCILHALRQFLGISQELAHLPPCSRSVTHQNPAYPSTGSHSKSPIRFTYRIIRYPAPSKQRRRFREHPFRNH